MTRIFTDDELRRLERSPRQQLSDALAGGDVAAVRTVTDSLERSLVGTVVGTRNWVACTMAHAATYDDGKLLAELIDVTHRCFCLHPDPADVGDATQTVVDEVVGHARSNDMVAAVACFDAMEAVWRLRQDFARDWLSMLLSHIYRSRGLDALESSLRYSATRTLFGWMPVDMARPPEKRLPTWVRMLQGHFSNVRIEEDDEKFTLTQDPCGTCTRQIEQGRYDEPLGLAIVEERTAATWFRGDTPIYRTHVPVWHVSLAREVVGVPWPVNQCPAGLGTGPCKVLLYKDPFDPRADEQVSR
jgi:hypothetical protein